MLPGLKTYYKATVIKWGVTGTGRSESNTSPQANSYTCGQLAFKESERPFNRKN